MGAGAGLAAQVGIATEAVVGTPVAVTTFTRFNPGETLERRPNFVQGKGLPASSGGLAPLAARRLETSHDAGGGIQIDAPTKGLGKWLQHMLGSYAATAAQIAATTAYRQIHNLAVPDGKTFTLQKGVPSTDGTLNPLTFSGCKILDWTLTSGPNAIATIDLTIDAIDVQPSGAGPLGLQTASYDATTGEFAFHQLQVAIASAMTVVSGLWTPTAPASPGVVRQVSLKGGFPRDNTRWQAGSTTKAEALANDYQPITGQLDVDFASMALYNEFATNVSTVLQFTFLGALIAAGNFYTLQFTMPAAFLESGSSPKVASNGVVTSSYPFTALDDGVNGVLQVEFISTDATI